MSSTSRPSTPTPTPTHAASSTPMALIVLAWALVVLPLLYGLVQTIRTASALFTG